MSDASTGTVTFLFTDIEGSTERWQLDNAAMALALSAHDELIRAVVAARGGVVFKHTGDGMCAVFTSASLMQRTTVKLPDELDPRLRHEAQRRGSTVSALTREASENLLGVHHGKRRLLAARAGASGRDDISSESKRSLPARSRHRTDRRRRAPLRPRR
jgi:class 3 adenylate cyclase